MIIFRYFPILLVPLFFMQCSDRKESWQLVVEASITAGEPVENISVRMIDEAGVDHAKPVSDADVRLLSDGETFVLREIKDKPGYYAYSGSDLEIISGKEYMLWVRHDAALAVTSTVVKADTLVEGAVEKELGYSFAKN